MGGSVGILGLYIEGDEPRCQTVSPVAFTNRSWAELVLMDLGAPLTTNNINNVLLWMQAANPSSSWWGNNNPLDLTMQDILDTIMQMESGNYTSLTHGTSGASGAYQFMQSTWQTLTKQFGIGTAYPYAAVAPPAVQDQIAANYVSQILQRNNNNIAVIPLEWYTGNPKGNITPQQLAANNGLQPSTYQANWLNKYRTLTAATPLDAGGGSYADLSVAAYDIALRIGTDTAYGAIRAALMNNSSSADFSIAVVQSRWDPGHYGVGAAGAGVHNVPGRGLDYVAAAPIPAEVPAPIKNGANISGANGVGWNFVHPQVWGPNVGPLPPGVDSANLPDTPIDISTLPVDSSQVPPTPFGTGGFGDGGFGDSGFGDSGFGDSGFGDSGFGDGGFGDGGFGDNGFGDGGFGDGAFGDVAP